ERAATRGSHTPECRLELGYEDQCAAARTNLNASRILESPDTRIGANGVVSTLQLRQSPGRFTFSCAFWCWRTASPERRTNSLKARIAGVGCGGPQHSKSPDRLLESVVPAVRSVTCVSGRSLR